MKKDSVIVVEDDEGIRDVLSIVLNELRCNFKIYDNGSAFLSKEFIPADLAILDKQLSGTDGLDLCAYIKNNHLMCSMKVLMISASRNIDKLAAKAGADAWLEKPFTLDDLRKQISDLLK